MVKSQAVLSVEQPLTMTCATLRLVHLGWWEIKPEPTPMAERKSKADSTYIGRPKKIEDPSLSKKEIETIRRRLNSLGYF